VHCNDYKDSQCIQETPWQLQIQLKIPRKAKTPNSSRYAPSRKGVRSLTKRLFTALSSAIWLLPQPVRVQIHAYPKHQQERKYLSN
jgi:hypothetical protein